MLRRAISLLRPAARLTPDEWAAANRIYPKSAAIPGRRNPRLTPYIIAPERAAAAGHSKRIVMVEGSQMGKTEALLDLAGHRLAQRPAPILYVGPAKQFLTEQFEPRVMNLLDEASALAMLVARGKRMTKTRKVVAGVPFRLAHAGSSAALKSDPAALAFVDEYDEMLKNIKGQGDPLGLVERRGDTYPDFVCVVTSTCTKGIVHTYRDEDSGLTFWREAPTEDIESPIWRLWQQGTRHHWAWPCPHCGEYFIPRADEIRYPANATPDQALTSTYMQCPHCGGVIEERHKPAMNESGHYVAPGQTIDREGHVTGEPPASTTLSFWVSGFCSPFVTFGERVAAYLEAVALGDDDKMQTAINAGYGELYSPGGRDVKEWQQVARRRTPISAGEVPVDVMRLSCAVDVQKNELIYSVRGWGARATSWQIESDHLTGYTNEPEIWTDLAHLLMSTFGGLSISLMLIDTGFRPDKPEEGSHNTVYQFCRRFSRVLAVKGAAALSAPYIRSRVKVTVPGQAMPVHINLVRLDTDYWKSRVHERLSWPVDQPGGFWLNADATEDYCRQLVSEVRKVAPNGKPEWIRISRRNHWFDCEAMNEAAGHMLNAQKIPGGTQRQTQLESEPEPDDDQPTPSPPPQPQPPGGSAGSRLMAKYAQRFNGP